MSKYREQILYLRTLCKSPKEICAILGCSVSTVSYHIYSSEQTREIRRNKTLRDSGKAYEDRMRYKKRNRIFVENYLLEHPCVDCGIKDTRVLEFDHVRGKKDGNISHAVNQIWSLEKLIKEIDKCEVRCANCHRIVTKERYKINN